MGETSKQWFEQVCLGLEFLKVDYRINPYLVWGLDYYGQTCFEFKVDSEELGVSQNTVLAGGRYDDLAT